jgi:hypothetical protein
MRKGWWIAASVLSLLPGMAFSREAPTPQCMDARRMQEVFQASPRVLAIALDDGGRYRLDLARDCPGALDGDGHAQVLAPAGWVCNDGAARVRSDAQECPVAAVTPVDARLYAGLIRQSHRDADGVRTLGTVTVKGERRHGFVASPNYCFSARHLRSWTEDGDGLIVEVSPKRSAGHRYYRVELVHSCAALTSSPGIQLRSGFGSGVICGNPGDRVEVVPDNAPGQAAGFMASIRGRQTSGFALMDCPINAVYPITQD